MPNADESATRPDAGAGNPEGIFTGTHSAASDGADAQDYWMQKAAEHLHRVDPHGTRSATEIARVALRLSRENDSRPVEPISAATGEAIPQAHLPDADE